jgi:DNA adenine methylase
MQLSPLRYPGGKSRASKILAKYIPVDVEEVVSPFFGGGSFENHLALKGFNVRGFDLCQPLVDFWVAFLTDRDRLFVRFRELSTQILKPEYYGDISKELRLEQRTLFKEWKETAMNSEDSFERGVHYFALNRGAFSGMTLIAGPMSTRYVESKMGARATANLEKIEFRVESVGYQDCFQTLEENRSTFLYLDPPYVMETESKESIYGDKGDLHRGFDHTALRDSLASHRGRWVLSYLDVPVVRELYSDFNIQTETWTYTMKPGTSRPPGKELVITNF